MLHIVNKSPFEKNSLQTCLRLSKQSSTILLIEDGVYSALKGNNFESDLIRSMQDRKIYALGPDLKARGIDDSKVIYGISIVDYNGFVNLAVDATKVQSWL